MILLLFLLLLSRYFRSTSADPDYHESLHFQPLPSASLLASFNFRSNSSLTSFEQQHFRFIPRSLGQIIQHSRTRELHLRFSTGRWDAESWGARPWAGFKEGGTGVELWAWVEADTDEEYLKTRTREDAVLIEDLGHLHGGSHSIMPSQAYSALPSILLIPPEQRGR